MVEAGHYWLITRYKCFIRWKCCESWTPDKGCKLCQCMQQIHYRLHCHNKACHIATRLPLHHWNLNLIKSVWNQVKDYTVRHNKHSHSTMCPAFSLWHYCKLHLRDSTALLNTSLRRQEKCASLGSLITRSLGLLPTQAIQNQVTMRLCVLTWKATILCLTTTKLLIT